jgi:UDP-3-O-[3-hydroxymyristoyl] glucosamine N-acyltransferase
MHHPGFFQREGPFPLHVIASAVDGKLLRTSDATKQIEDLRPLTEAGDTHLTFCAGLKFAKQLATTRAAACLIHPKNAEMVPEGSATVVTETPHRAFATAIALLYPEALRLKIAEPQGIEDGGLVHPTAEIGEGVRLGPGAIVEREARIGHGTTIAAGAIVGYRVFIGKDCYIGPGASITHSLLSDRVTVHAGARIGQDGFGYSMSADGHLKVPQIGRVLIADDVEIGANSTIDRGFMMDTNIGEGTKIDNLVQIAHNVTVGRHCIIVSQSGVAGSARLGDHVIMGAHSGVSEHVTIGDGAQIAGMAHVKNDVAAKARMGGTPARPFNEWARELAVIRRLSKDRKSRKASQRRDP